MGDFEEFENEFEDQYGHDDDINPDDIEEDYILDPCPECGCEMEAQWSGLKCDNCGYFECY